MPDDDSPPVHETLDAYYASGDADFVKDTRFHLGPRRR